LTTEYPNKAVAEQLIDFAECHQSEAEMAGWHERQYVLDYMEFKRLAIKKMIKKLKAEHAADD
jgi:hypothetical protein